VRAGAVVGAMAGAVVGTGFGAGLLVASAAPAAAHTALKASSPKDGGKIAVAPSRLLMEFTEPILGVGSQVVVRGPDGTDYRSGAAQIVDNKLTLPLKPLGPAGAYRVTFRVVAADGHSLTSGMRFTLTKPGPAAGGAKAVAQPAPLVPVTAYDAAKSVNNAPPWGAWVGGTIAVLSISGAVAFGRRVTRGLD
jgi:methionine-rich copper-binding protein CopC